MGCLTNFKYVYLFCAFVLLWFHSNAQRQDIFPAVHLIVTNEIRTDPFGVHAWTGAKESNADLNINTTLKNDSASGIEIQEK
jgi:hypothetical protein